jgi:hypothetical protein
MDQSSAQQSSTHFIMQLSEAYSFRNLIAIIKSENDGGDVSMVLSPNQITFSFLNKTQCAIYDIVLNTKEFTYQYNIVDTNGNLQSEYSIGFESNAMSNNLKNVGKRDGLRIYWLKDDNKLNIQPIKSAAKATGRTGAIFVPIKQVERVNHASTGIYSINANARLEAKIFADICASANTNKCVSVEIVGKEAGMTIMGFTSNNTMAFVENFQMQFKPSKSELTHVIPSNLDEILSGIRNLSIDNRANGLKLNIITAEQLMTIRIPIKTIKALSKIHNISAPGANLQFYFSPGNPHKIESQIGNYGSLSMYLRTR